MNKKGFNVASVFAVFETIGPYFKSRARMLVNIETPTVASKTLERGCRMISAGSPSLFGFGVGGGSCSNFLASTDYQDPQSL